MLIFQYKCEDCSSIFEHLAATLFKLDLACVACGSQDILRADDVCFYPNKVFCPHTGKVEVENVKKQLGHIMINKQQSCTGCSGSKKKCKKIL